MWKTLKELIRGEQRDTKDICVDNIDFEIVVDINKCNVADKFNIYYVQSISNIVKSINIDKSRGTNRRIIYIIESTGFNIENFDMIKVENLEEIVIKLSKKKRIEE